MFKKEGNEQTRSTPARGAQGTSAAQQGQGRRGSGQATIGPSILVKGDITGDEDLVIQGRVEGSVKLAQHNVTVGGNGRVKADVSGRTVVVEGEVTGDLRAQEQIILRHTAQVEGSIAAPRVALEDGAIFRGTIEMDSARSGGGVTKPSVPRKAAASVETAPDADSEDPGKAAGPKSTGSTSST
jgi:cytoskeletal protein CcmA (bactofilin family)